MSGYTLLLNGSDEKQDGDLFTELYGELRKIARGLMALERPGHTLTFLKINSFLRFAVCHAMITAGPV